MTYVLNFFEQSDWRVDEDSAAQRSLRRSVEESIPERLSQIRAGDLILNKGETVSQHHLTKLHAMKRALAEKQQIWAPLPLIGCLLFAGLVIFVTYLFFKTSHQEMLTNTRKLFLYVTIIILTLVISKVTEYFLVRNMSGLLEVVRYPLFIPFAAILICVLVGAETAIFSCCFLAIFLGLFLAVDHTRFITVNFFAGMMAIYASKNLRKRKEVFATCGKVWLFCIPLFFIYYFAENSFWSVYLISDLVTTFTFLTSTSILVMGLLPIFESLFDVMTDITLMEYMDPNNELLRRLSVEAPGTYQHSLVVGSISEAAAQAIGANGLFCRVSTLYHDIGKLFNPHYFTENQMGGFNIHQLLTPQESSQVIIAHVSEGEALARKHRLPKSFIDIIREHHGTTLVYYFFCKQIEQSGGIVNPEVEAQFRYPGPKPKSKESAIIMIADTVEAASRSLEEVNEETIREMVERLVGEKLEDGQFDESQLTFHEFQKVKHTIIKTLALARHLRIRFPVKKS